MQIPHFNPYARMIKQYLAQLLSDRYTESIDETADRAVHSLVTKKDAENFTVLLQEVYQAGYNKAIETTKEAMAKQGMRMKVMPPKG